MRGGNTRIKPGQHLSVATEFKPGQTSWMSTHKHSTEARKLLSLAHTGKTLTAEHKRKIGLALKGRVLSLEHKNKISSSHRGMKKPWAAVIGAKVAEKHRGPAHWNWKGGVSRACKQGYWSSEYKTWRRMVFVRDSYTCRQCGVTHTSLQAHHIKPFAKYVTLRFNVDNGVTLCDDCHKRLHRR